MSPCQANRSLLTEQAAAASAAVAVDGAKSRMSRIISSCTVSISLLPPLTFRTCGGTSTPILCSGTLSVGVGWPVNWPLPKEVPPEITLLGPGTSLLFALPPNKLGSPPRWLPLLLVEGPTTSSTLAQLDGVP